MPVALGFFLFAGPLGSVFSFGSLVAASQIAIGVGITLAGNMLFRPKIPDAPTPEDGKFNLRQNVPSLAVVLGRTKKASDYAALEEKRGEASHVMVVAGHRINGFIRHYMHDEETTFGLDGYSTSPDHFGQQIYLETRLGLNAETAYQHMVDTFPTIWSEDHRGDGLATVYMVVDDVSADVYQRVFPQQMPAHSCELEGALVYDPRTEQDPDDPDTWTFSENIALLRLFHLTHPSGGKLSLSDMELADWSHAADVCDEDCSTLSEGIIARFHGGFWYRYENDPIEIGRILDQAGELIVYETDSGKIGVHAGEFVTPTVRLTADSIRSITYDANRRKSTNVLAIRGRYTDPGKFYNTVDAAIYGDPYVNETEYSKTVNNVAVQKHNHMQRLQKLAFIRANAPKVRFVCDYEDAKLLPYKRFITVHYPSKLMNAIVEITGRPKLSLKNLVYEVEGIVVPSTLYDFDAATEEGLLPADIEKLEREDVPAPEGLTITVERETLAGGQNAAYAAATWDPQSTAFIVELEWQKTSGGPIQSARSSPDLDEIRTGYLSDGEEYRFRARNWSSVTPSDWTDYEIATAVANPTPPLALTSFTVVGGLGHATCNFATAGGDANLDRIAVYRVPTGGVLDKDAHFGFRIGAAPGTSFPYVDGDNTVASLLTNGTFAVDANWTKGAGWTIAAGVATHAAGTGGNLTQSGLAAMTAVPYRYAGVLSGRTAGTLTPFTGGGTALGAGVTANGAFRNKITPVAGSTNFGFSGTATFDGSIDDAVFFQETAACAPQGIWDYIAIPENGSGVEGPQFTLQTATVI